jgi:hypothetical protein
MNGGNTGGNYANKIGERPQIACSAARFWIPGQHIETDLFMLFGSNIILNFVLGISQSRVDIL